MRGGGVRDARTVRAFDALLNQLSTSGVELITRHDSKVIERFEQAIADSVGLPGSCSYEMRWALRAYKRTGLLSEQLGGWLAS